MMERRTFITTASVAAICATGVEAEVAQELGVDPMDVYQQGFEAGQLSAFKWVQEKAKEMIEEQA